MENLNVNSEVKLQFENEILKMRIKKFNTTIEEEIIKGNVVLSKDDVEFTAIILEKGEPVNHILHGIVTLLTLIWAIVWLVIVASAEEDKKFKLSVDENGNVKRVPVGDNTNHNDKNDNNNGSNGYRTVGRSSGMSIAARASGAGII
jgi:hypothetical protein